MTATSYSKDNSQVLWELLKKDLKKTFPEETFNTWFDKLEFIKEKDESIVFRTENDFAAIWIHDNYHDLLKSKLTKILGKSVKVNFVAEDADEVEEEKPKKINTVNKLKENKASASIDSGSSSLNQRNTFDNFVVGAGNQLAHAAAIAVANAPARAYNPLFLYGDTGLGKTHLMHSIGHHFLNNNAKSKVVYISTEKFTNEFITAIQGNAVSKFRKKFRSSDILLIDDVHFLSGKERIQEEFFHTFNELFESHRQIVLCSDRPASEISRLENRLVSRFQWGLVCDIQAPDLETRIAILKKKASASGLDLPNDVLEFLAERVTKNVRRMEGALNRLCGHMRLLNTSPLSVSTVENLLRDIFQEEQREKVEIEDIQKSICEYYKITLSDILGKKRPASIAFPRQVAMYLSRILTTQSLQEIGKAFGGRDHGTVIHACKSVENAMSQNESVKRTVQFLQQKLVFKR